MKSHKSAFFLSVLIPVLTAALTAWEEPELFRENSGFDPPFYKELSRSDDPALWLLENRSRMPLLSDRESEAWQKRMEEDIEQWAQMKLQTLLPSFTYRELVPELDRLNREWTFKTGDGGILYDAAGDPLLRSVDPRQVRLEQSLWKQESELLIHEALNKWSGSTEFLKDSLLRGIPGEFKDSVHQVLDLSLEEYHELLKKETDRLLCWSSAKMDFLKSEDNFSLRQKSEDLSAEALADSLLQSLADEMDETESSLDRGLRELQIQSAAEGICPETEEWEQLFKSEFQKGLDKWAQAEETFFSERLDWELRAEQNVLETEKVWGEALKLFASRREEWIDSVKQQMETGLAFWESEENQLLSEFSAFAAELEYSAEEQESKFKGQVESALSVYGETLQLLNSAEQNKAYYRDKIDYYQKKMDSLDVGSSVVSAVDGKDSSKIKPDLNFPAGTIAVILDPFKEMEELKAIISSYQEELDLWKDLELSLQSQLKQAENMLLDLESTAFGYDDSVATGNLERDVEQMRNQAEYLYQQWMISEAVVLYARTDSSLRDTEAETREQLEEAERELADSLTDYESAFQSLASVRDEMTCAQEEVEVLRESLDRAESEMTAAEQSFRDSWAIYLNNNPQVLEDTVSALKQKLSLWYEGDGEAAERVLVFQEYISAGEWERRNSHQEFLDRIIRDLKGEETHLEADNFRDAESLNDALALLRNRDIFNPEKNLEDILAEYTEELYLKGELEWNALVLDQLPAFTRSGDYRNSLEQNLFDAEMNLLLEKTALLQELLFSLSEGSPVRPESEAYRSYLQEEGFTPGSEDREAVSVFISELEGFAGSGMNLQQIYALLGDDSRFWLDALDSQNNSLLCAGYLDVILSGPVNQVLLAEAGLRAYDSMAQWTCSYSSLAEEGLLFAGSSEEFVERLSNFSSLEELFDWYCPLLQEGVMPEYLQKGINAYVVQNFQDHIQTAEGAPSETEEYRSLLMDRLSSLAQEEKSSSLKDSDFITRILMDAFDAVHQAAPDMPLSDAQTHLNRFYENELLSVSWQQSIEKLESDLALSRDDREAYKTRVADRDRDLYLQKKRDYQSVLQKVETALGEFDDIQSAYVTEQRAFEESYRQYQDACRTHQLAKEIVEYASGAYSSGEYNVYSVCDTRREDYNRARNALSVLEDIQAVNPAHHEADGEWEQILQDGQDLLSLSNTIAFARQELVSELGDLNREKADTLWQLQEVCSDFIDFSFRDNLEYSFDQELMSGSMSSFSSWKNENYKSHLDRYFSQSDSSGIFTRDLLHWFEQMASYSDSGNVLKLFSYMYYAELRQMEGMDWDTIKSEYTIDLFNDPRHKDLLSMEGTAFKPLHIAYEADLEAFKRGEYETVSSWVIYEVEYIRVFIEPEEWLMKNTAPFLGLIRNDKTLHEHYAFYKMLMYSGAFRNNSLKYAMEKDLSMMAWRYIDTQAEEQQDRYKNIFGNLTKKGKDIRDKRDTLKISTGAYNGVSARNAASSAADTSRSLEAALSGISDRIKLLSPENLSSVQQFYSLLGSLTGISLTKDQKLRSEDLFRELSAFDKSSALTLFDGLLSELSQHILLNKQQRQLRENELRDRQYEAELTLNEVYEGELWNPESYRSAAEELYLRGEFYGEEYGKMSLESLAGADNPFSRESLYNLQSYGARLVEIFHQRLTDVKKNKYSDFRYNLQQLNDQKNHWQQLSKGLAEEGMRQWQQSYMNLIARRNDWRGCVGREFERKNTLWDRKYSLLVNNKNQWVTFSTRNVLEQGAESFASRWNLESDRLLSQLNYQLVSDLVLDSPSVSQLISRALGGRTMNHLLDSISGLSLTSYGSIIQKPSLALLPDRQSALLQIDQSHKNLQEQVHKAMAWSRADQMKELVEQFRVSLADTLEDANQSVDQSVEAQLADSGYLRQGNSYTRSVLIDSSLVGGNESESQRIQGYRYFKAPEFDHEVNLDTGTLAGLSSEMIEASVKLAQKKLNQYIDLVFGKDEEEGIRSGLDSGFISFLEEAERRFADSAQYSDEDISETRGLFNFYLGYAPVMDEEDPEEVGTQGYGEFGRIYELFFRQQARLFRGLASVNSPWYMQKIWDDDSDNNGESDGLLGAPTVRSLADIAMNVAGTFLGPGIGPLLLNLVDDALFSLLDVNNGLNDFKDASIGFLKNAGSTLVSAGAGALGNMADKLGFLTNTGLLEVAGDIGIQGVSTMASNYGTAALYSLDPDSDGWNWNTFNSMTSWDNTGAGFLSGLTGVAVSGTLDLGTFGFLGSAGDDALNFTSLSGGLAASGLEYALSGETTLNLLKMGDERKVGVLELNLGSGNSLFNLGTGGTDISLETLSSALRGVAVYSENIKINSAVEDKDLRAGMRTLYSHGVSETDTLYRDLLEGNASLTVGEGQNYQGYTSVDDSGQRDIDLNREGLSRLDLAVLLAHEAFRDGEDNGDAGQILETLEAASSHMEIAAELQQRYGAGYLNEENNREALVFRSCASGAVSPETMAAYILNNYETDRDFWKRLNDGRIVRDGFSGLYDEEGNLIRAATDEQGNQLGEEDSLHHYIDPETSEYLKYLTTEQLGMIRYYPSSEDVNTQVSRRDGIISSYETLQSLNRSGFLSGSEYQKAMEGVFQEMAAYNNSYVLKGIAVTPEAVISQNFGAVADRMKTRKDGETQYLSYTHPAIDTVEGLGIYSPGFTIPGADKHDYAFGMDIVGMENNYLIEHLNPADVNELLLRKLLYPGERLMDFPEQMFPADGGGSDVHAHIEVSSYNSELGEWGFSNPVGDWSDWSSGEMFSGYYERLRILDDGGESWRKDLYTAWDYWNPWY
ncbi:MAG: hypothetical protein PQJ58_07095 [Spirochaetales bacterium]|nr:hypothetical protein [Spirochaetales bacterium]